MKEPEDFIGQSCSTSPGSPALGHLYVQEIAVFLKPFNLGSLLLGEERDPNCHGGEDGIGEWVAKGMGTKL